MEFSVDRKALESALANAMPAAKGSDYPVKVQVESDSIKVVATNLDVTVSTKVPANVTTQGTVYLPYGAFADRIKALPDGAVAVTVEDTTATLKAGKAKFGLTVVVTDRFPNITLPKGDATSVKASSLTAAVKQVVPTASTDAARGAMTGVLFEPTDEGLNLVATDSYRLAVRTLTGSGLLSASAVVPASALSALHRTMGDADIAVRADEHAVAFSSSDTVVMARLLADPFPRYGALIPDEFATRWTVDRQKFLEALRRAEVTLKGSSSPVRLALGDETALSASTSEDDFSEAVEGKLEGDAITFAVNPSYLRAGVEACTAETVTIGLNDPMKPVGLTAVADPGFRYIVMPVRI